MPCIREPGSSTDPSARTNQRQFLLGLYPLKLQLKLISEGLVSNSNSLCVILRDFYNAINDMPTETGIEPAELFLAPQEVLNELWRSTRNYVRMFLVCQSQCKRNITIMYGSDGWAQGFDHLRDAPGTAADYAKSPYADVDQIRHVCVAILSLGARIARRFSIGRRLNRTLKQKLTREPTEIPEQPQPNDSEWDIPYLQLPEPAIPLDWELPEQVEAVIPIDVGDSSESSCSFVSAAEITVTDEDIESEEV
ncbi:hypothetical protein TWF696_007906 [Orbilia brochopaga]|uniref:Uncharacterized protein n=1 Tax=Orbilia brochopaga TaxID=3140254 RepID=A0AAV9UQ96_9PEZI